MLGSWFFGKKKGDDGEKESDKTNETTASSKTKEDGDEGLGTMVFSNVNDWSKKFKELAKAQNKALGDDKGVKDELVKNKMNVCYIS
eukprot:g5423.t1